jgi:serine/threonine protein kinase
MEYFENGDLAQYIPSISTEDEMKQITIDLLEGLRIMHAEGFAHRDLKPQVYPYSHTSCLTASLILWLALFLSIDTNRGFISHRMSLLWKSLRSQIDGGLRLAILEFRRELRTRILPCAPKLGRPTFKLQKFKAL